ncbi:8667_t:CDS:1 [Racocetra persica]|uniref:8667_t:CDS:1 n=1 Tax=Racocetra persica TaxID=160502 RepID=A0ACA9KUS1_9GLOM|nr:8667_t:CDS:1 [Racocetra persica]
MSQSNKPHRLRTNATQACTNCQTRHRRCEWLSERDICPYCRRYGLNCITTPGRRRGRRPRSPRTTEAIYSFETVVSFIGQGQMPNDQNTASINSYEPSLRITETLINQELTQITTSINPYETTTTHLGTSHTYNHISTIPSFGPTYAFIDQGQTLDDQNIAPINPYEPFFETTGTLIDHEPTSNHSHIYNHITTIPSFGTTDAFIGRQTLDDQNAVSINFYESFLGTTGAFIGQELTPNHQNTTSINTTIPSFGQGHTLDDQNTKSIINQEPTPIITLNNPYEITTTEELQFFYPNFETLHIYDYNLLRAAKATAEAFAEATVDRFIVYNRNFLLETAEAFADQGSSLDNQNTTTIFREAFIAQEQTPNNQNTASIGPCENYY